MNIENEKDLQVWTQIFMIALGKYSLHIEDVVKETDCAFVEYKKRAKALEEALNKPALERRKGYDDHPFLRDCRNF